VHFCENSQNCRVLV